MAAGERKRTRRPTRVGTVAPTVQAEQISARFLVLKDSGRIQSCFELRSNGQPRGAVPTRRDES